MKKYYWILYTIGWYQSPPIFYDKCIDIHPLEYKKQADRNANFVLHSWKEITEEEYNIFHGKQENKNG